MDPKQLFPALALVFAVLGVAAGLRRRHWRGAPLTWLWLALCFAAVSVWLHRAT